MPFLLSLFFILNVFGAEISIPALTSPVMDEAELLSDAEKQDLSSLIYEINAHKGPQIQIFIVNDLQGLVIEDFSIKVAEKWQLGTKKDDNGLLIIISKNDRKVRIEVGQGLEGEITDYDSNKYIRGVIVAAFKQGLYHEGLKTVLLDVARRFNITEGPGQGNIVRRAPRRANLLGINQNFIWVLFLAFMLSQVFFRKRPIARGFAGGLATAGTGFFMLPGLGLGLFILFFIGLVLGVVGISNLFYAMASSRGGRGGGWGGGGGFGGGGGWSGGGGGFSGGGSSGSW